MQEAKREQKGNYEIASALSQNEKVLHICNPKLRQRLYSQQRLLTPVS